MRRSFLVYLAGPITGLTYGNSTNWRQYAKDHLNVRSEQRVECLSPMRHKEFLSGSTNLLALGYDNHVLSSQRGITNRDRFDCTRADAVLVNMIGATQISAGTVMEIAWADLRRIPIILAMEPDGSNPHEHAMVRECCAFRCDTLDDALETTFQVLIP
jgi:nucleoside 2-deoxyribosyltransferase